MAIKRIFFTRQAEIRQVIRPQGHSLSIFLFPIELLRASDWKYQYDIAVGMLFAKQVDFAYTYTDLANLLY